MNLALHHSEHARRAPAQRGFTIIELMVTLVVAAILLAIAIPSFTYLTVSSKLSTTANSLVNNLMVARMEAVKRNADMNVCANNTTTTGIYCNIVPAGSTTQFHAGIIGIQPGVINFQAGAATPTYGSQGLARSTTGSTNAPFDQLVAGIYSTQISSNNARCVYLTSGSVISTCTQTYNTLTNAACTGAPSGSCQ